LRVSFTYVVCCCCRHDRGAGSVAGQAPALQIPVIISLTGGASFIGKSDQQSLQLLEARVNKAGGINHRQVHFQYLDDGRTRKLPCSLPTK